MKTGIKVAIGAGIGLVALGAYVVYRRRKRAEAATVAQAQATNVVTRAGGAVDWSQVGTAGWRW